MANDKNGVQDENPAHVAHKQSEASTPQIHYPAGFVSKKTLRRAVIVVIVAVAAIASTAAIFVYSKFAPHTERMFGSSVSPEEIVETFEISSLDYEYSNIIFEENKGERKFLFVTLEDSVQMYAVQYDGSVKMGIDGKDIKIDKQYDGASKILKITIPKAYIVSHDAPLNDSTTVIYDIANHTEHASIGQYTELFNKYKKETETKIVQNSFLDKAQESARKQLESFLNAIPDIRDNYKLKFILE